jgi:hypothetical protein
MEQPYSSPSQRRARRRRGCCKPSSATWNNLVGRQQLHACLLVPDSGNGAYFGGIIVAMFNSEDILTSCSQCVLFLLIIMYFFLYSYVVAGEGSQRISVQILVVHGYLLGRRVSDSTCWSHTSEGQECLEDRMGYKPCDHRLLCNLSIHVFCNKFFYFFFDNMH